MAFRSLTFNLIGGAKNVLTINAGFQKLAINATPQGLRLMGTVSSNPINATTSLNEVDPSSPGVTALLARLNVNFSDSNIIRQVLTHPSFMTGKTANNDRLRYLGKKAISLYVAEYFHVKYPNIPSSTLEDVIKVHFEPYALAEVGTGFGMNHLIHWKADQNEEDRPAGFEKIVGKAVQALVGGIYHDKGSKAAKEFVHKFLLTRDIDVLSLLPLTKPKKTLASLLRSKSMEDPISRLLKETGRLSNRPIFIVGVYSGTTKLGESYGSSLKMAEFRACKDALIRHYLEELKDFQLPSETEDQEHDVTFFPTKLHDNPSRI